MSVAGDLGGDDSTDDLFGGTARAVAATRPATFLFSADKRGLDE